MAKQKVKFNNCWTEIYSVCAVSGDICNHFCIPCYKKLTCDHHGIKYVADDCRKESHKKCLEASKKQGNLKFSQAQQ